MVHAANPMHTAATKKSTRLNIIMRHCRMGSDFRQAKDLKFRSENQLMVYHVPSNDERSLGF